MSVCVWVPLCISSIHVCLHVNRQSGSAVWAGLKWAHCRLISIPICLLTSSKSCKLTLLISLVLDGSAWPSPHTKASTPPAAEFRFWFFFFNCLFSQAKTYCPFLILLPWRNELSPINPPPQSAPLLTAGQSVVAKAEAVCCDQGGCQEIPGVVAFILPVMTPCLKVVSWGSLMGNVC